MAHKEEKDVNPLAPAVTQVRSDEEIAISSPKKLRRRRCIICGGCCVATLLILGLVILILALTLFKVKEPVIRMNSISIDRLNISTSGSGLAGPTVKLNVTLTANIAVKNPNVASFKFGNNTTTVNYRGETVAAAIIPAGKASARRTLKMNVTVDLLTDRLMGDLNFMNDIASGALTVNTNTKIGGRVNVLNIFKRHVDVAMNCTITVRLSDQAIEQQNCDRKVKL